MFSKKGAFLKLAVSATPENATAIRELLSVWDLSWVSPEDSEVVIVYGRKPHEAFKKTLLIPSNSIDFENWIRHSKYAVVKRSRVSVSITATSKINLSFTPDVSYEIKPAPSGEYEDLFIPRLDFVEEYKRTIWQTLNAGLSVMYRLATSFPLPYNIAPKRLRNYLMKEYDERSMLNLCDALPLDALRFALRNAIEHLSKEKLRRRTWDRLPSVCVLTHDVDTWAGLKKSGKVKKLEEKYALPSAWFVPSKQYPLDRKIIEDLGNYGEVGSHDTKHDGRLSYLSKRKLTERLSEGKRSLECITNHAIVGFRAPLLQHTSDLLLGLKECGFKYDTSIPTWEPKHPRVMSPHGIGTLFPTSIKGISEIPVTLVQDHQLLNVLSLPPKKAIAKWFSNMSVIKELGGFCVFLSHPEYGLLDTQGLPYYEELLNAIASDSKLLTVTPKRTLHL